MKFTGERFIPNDTLLKDEIGYEHLHRYHSIAKLVKDKTVLDIACGVGYGSAIIAEHAANVTGVDIDKESIEWAKEQYVACSNLQFNYGSVDAIPFSNSMFDVIISFDNRTPKPGNTRVVHTRNKKSLTPWRGFNNVHT